MRALAVAEFLSKAQIVSSPLERGGAATVGEGGAICGCPPDYGVPVDFGARLSAAAARPPTSCRSCDDLGARWGDKVAARRDGRGRRARFGLLPTRGAPRREGTALAALEAAAPSANSLSTGVTTYGELEPDIFSPHRLTILQLGDSHTAADIFTGRVRERLQQAFGTGGDAYIVPGKPHIGVRSALFESDATDGWTYEALQKSDAKRRFYLSGFNAIAHHAGAALTLRSRGGRGYDRVEVAFLKEPGGGRAEVLIDGTPTGSIDLDGAADERATLSAAGAGGAVTGFRDIAVRSLERRAGDGHGRRRRSRGRRRLLPQPGLSRRDRAAAAEARRRRTSPTICAGFRPTSSCSPSAPTRASTTISTSPPTSRNTSRSSSTDATSGPACASSSSDRPTPRGRRASATPPASARTARPPGAQIAAGPAAGQCRFPTPPKLGLVREAQRKLARTSGAIFWDWSSVMPGPCGAQTWAAANPPLMAHDYVHMTLDGYKLSADRFADFLIPLIEGRQTGAHVVSND